jgi:uncharacterized protein YndB with AHSA1/START domain
MAQINNADVEIQDRELVITRVFDAPRELVYKVWTDPEHVKNWWGPRGVTNPVCEIDLRPGGSYFYLMVSSKGHEYPATGKFIEIVKNKKLVYTEDMFAHQEKWKSHIGNLVGPDVDFSTLQMINTVKFEDHGKQTKLTITARFGSNELRDVIVNGGMAGGATESLEKFAEELARINKN